MTQRDILNSIDREMSGNLAAGLKCIGKSFLQVASYCSLPFFPHFPQIIFNLTYKSRFWPHMKCWNSLQYNVQGNPQNTLLIDCGIPQRELEPMTPPWFELLFPVLKWVFTFLVQSFYITFNGTVRCSSAYVSWDVTEKPWYGIEFWYRIPRIFKWKYGYSHPCPWTFKWTH